ncbi:MAG: glycosyltransferase family 2 protein [Lachnospiraceae bacterium]|nr:glycosyltransferase family 2 protein [Lachnospiraceae bacterium]
MISVLIPAYNVEAYIEKCIQAVEQQTYEELEILVVDDGSSDGTGDILDRLSREDDRLKVIHQENQGVAAARNRLIREAQGDWIAFVDSDDLVHPDYLACLYQAVSEQNVRIARTGFHDVTAFEAFDRQKKDHSVRIKPTRDFLLGKEEAYTLWTFLFDRKLWEGISFPDCRIAEDTGVLYKVLYPEEQLAEIENDGFYQHLVRKEGLIGEGRFSPKMVDRLQVLKERLEFYKEKKDEELIQYACLTYSMELLTDHNALKGKENKKLRQQILADYRTIYKEAMKEAVSKKQKWLFGIARYFPVIWGLVT